MTDYPKPVPPKPPIARFHCRHYGYVNGMGPDHGPKCVVGVDLSNASTNPCMPNGVGCDKRSDWTDEERETWKVWMTDHMERMVVVAVAIPNEGYGGSFQCPGCGDGTVRWSRARNNGHVHAACSTSNCFAIMQ